MGIFHREDIFYNPDSAWRRYSQDSSYFNFPERVTVEVTNRCNLQCSMCPRNKINMKSGDMQMGLFKKIIDEATGFLPVCLVPFFRGEPLLHPKFLEMLSYAKVKGLKPIQLATNAYFLTPALSKEILDLGVDFISFSIDASNPDIYEKIRLKSDFEKAFSNVLHFIMKRREGNYSLPQTQVSAVRTEENASFIDDFVKFWNDKVERIRIYQAHSLNGRFGSLPEDGNVQGARRPCLKLLTDIVIYYNGDIALCNHDWQRETFIGNVRDSSIADLWKSRIYQSIRKRHLNNELRDFSPCNFCSHWRTFYQKDHLIGEVYERDKISSY